MERLRGLDALRGIAALSVLAYHLHVFYHTPFFRAGPLAVDFFFMLSGYVMARTYEGRFPTPPSFLWRRFRRFWPTAMVGTAIGLGVLLTWGHVGPVEIMLALVMLPNPWTGWAFPLNPPVWSLFSELAANFIHGFLARASTRILLAAIAILTLVNTLAARHAHGLIAGPEFASVPLGIARVCLSYFIGVVLYRTWQDRPPLRIPALITALLLPVFLVADKVWWLDIVFVLLVCPLLIAGGLTWDSRWIAKFGTISFPLYAVHYPIMAAFALAGIAWPFAIAAALALAVLMSLDSSPVRAGAWVRRKAAAAR